MTKSYAQQNASENAISRHYAGPVRDRFYGEGMVRLRDILLAKAEAYTDEASRASERSAL